MRRQVEGRFYIKAQNFFPASRRRRRYLMGLTLILTIIAIVLGYGLVRQCTAPSRYVVPTVRTVREVESLDEETMTIWIEAADINLVRALARFPRLRNVILSESPAFDDAALARLLDHPTIVEIRITDCHLFTGENVKLQAGSRRLLDIDLQRCSGVTLQGAQNLLSQLALSTFTATDCLHLDKSAQKALEKRWPHVYVNVVDRVNMRTSCAE